MNKKVFLSLTLAVALALTASAASAAECSGAWRVLPRYNSGAGGPCAAIGLDTHQAVCQPGQRFATYCDDASGGRYRTCQSDIPCGGRGYGRDDRYRDDGYGRYQYNDDRRYREERWYRDDRYRDDHYRDRRGWDDNNRYRNDRVPDCTRWDYQHNRPCPPGTINRDCHGDCGRR